MHASLFQSRLGYVLSIQAFCKYASFCSVLFFIRLLLFYVSFFLCLQNLSFVGITFLHTSNSSYLHMFPFFTLTFSSFFSLHHILMDSCILHLWTSFPRASAFHTTVFTSFLFFISYFLTTPPSCPFIFSHVIVFPIPLNSLLSRSFSLFPPSLFITSNSHFAMCFYLIHILINCLLQFYYSEYAMLFIRSAERVCR